MRKRDKAGRFKASVWEKNKNEIIWNVVNSLLAGGLVFLGSLTSGELSWKGVIAGLMAFFVVAITKFKEYWASEKGEYSNKVFNFVH